MDTPCALCGSTLSLALHHTRKRSLGGKHTLGKLVTLCATCHLCVHDEHELPFLPFDAETAEDAINGYLDALKEE